MKVVQTGHHAEEGAVIPESLANMQHLANLCNNMIVAELDVLTRTDTFLVWSSPETC